MHPRGSLLSLADQYFGGFAGGWTRDLSFALVSWIYSPRGNLDIYCQLAWERSAGHVIILLCPPVDKSLDHLSGGFRMLGEGSTMKI